jgi:hypothetical protein
MRGGGTPAGGEMKRGTFFEQLPDVMIHAYFSSLYDEQFAS